VFSSEGGRETVGGHMGRCRLRRSDHVSFIVLSYKNREGKAAGLRRHGNKA
jgi:hypothetical protein